MSRRLSKQKAKFEKVTCLCSTCPNYGKCVEMAKKLRPLAKDVAMQNLPPLALILAFFGGIAFDQIIRDLTRKRRR